MNRPADHPAPMASLPLFQQGVGVPPPQTLQHFVADHDQRVKAEWQRMSPTQHGQAGAEDGHQHLKDRAPAFVLESLGDALMAFRGTEFTSEMVRGVAERSEAVAGWLNGPTRNACFSGWFRSRIRLHKLVRVSRPPAVAQRASRRGSVLPYWRFPTP